MTTTPAQRTVGVVLVTLAGVAIGYSFSDYAPLIPLLGPDLRIDAVRAGLLSTALFVVFLVATLVTTGLAERLAATSAWMSQQLGRELPGRVARALSARA